jgi:hypothetical protein
MIDLHRDYYSRAFLRWVIFLRMIFWVILLTLLYLSIPDALSDASLFQYVLGLFLFAALAYDTQRFMTSKKPVLTLTSDTLIFGCKGNHVIPFDQIVSVHVRKFNGNRQIVFVRYRVFGTKRTKIFVIWLYELDEPKDLIHHLRSTIPKDFFITDNEGSKFH